MKDANAPADVRDRDVARRASAIGYTVLMPLLLFAPASVFLGHGAATRPNAVLGAIVLAEGIARFEACEFPKMALNGRLSSDGFAAFTPPQ